MSITKITYSMIDGPQVNAKDHGASPSASIAANTAAFIAAFAAAANKTLVIENGVYDVGQLIATANNVRVIGNGATIRYNGNIAAASLTMVDCSIHNLNFDAQEYSIGNSALTGVKDSAIITASGNHFALDTCSFSNLHGLENNYQYAVVCEGKTISSVTNCRFTNIKTRTDSTNTGGFCGGYVIYSGGSDSMSAATHNIEGCVFKDIYTTKNAAGQLYPDSDAVRCYFYRYGTGVPGYDAAVKETVIRISGCSFVNVLKSAAKLQDCMAFFENCRIVVDDLKDQGQVDCYVGFRYQHGSYCKVSDCSMVGYIRIGALMAGSLSYVNNMYFGASNIADDQIAVTAGTTSDNTSYCGINNLSCSGTVTLAVEVQGATLVEITNSELVGEIASISFIKADVIRVSDTVMTQGIDNGYRAGYAPLVSKIVVDNCYINYTSDGFYSNNIVSSTAFDFVLSNTKIVNAREKLIESTAAVNLKISDCNIAISSALNSGRSFIDQVNSSSVRIYDTYISDPRTTASPAVMINTNSSTEVVEINGLHLVGNTGSDYTTVIYLSPSANNVELRDLTFDSFPSGCVAVGVSNSQNPCISNIRCNYTDANLYFYGNGKAIVNMFHGTLKASPGHIVAAGGTVVSEYNTTFL